MNFLSQKYPILNFYSPLLQKFHSNESLLKFSFPNVTFQRHVIPMSTSKIKFHRNLPELSFATFPIYSYSFIFLRDSTMSVDSCKCMHYISGQWGRSGGNDATGSSFRNSAGSFLGAGGGGCRVPR